MVAVLVLMHDTLWQMLSSIGRHPNVVRFVGVLFDGSHASHEAVHQHETAHLSTNEASHEASRVCPAQPSACSTHFPVCPASHEATHEDNGDTHEADEARSRPHEEASRPALVLEYLAGCEPPDRRLTKPGTLVPAR